MCLQGKCIVFVDILLLGIVIVTRQADASAPVVGSAAFLEKRLEEEKQVESLLTHRRSMCIDCFEDLTKLW